MANSPAQPSERAPNKRRLVLRYHVPRWRPISLLTQWFIIDGLLFAGGVLVCVLMFMKGQLPLDTNPPARTVLIVDFLPVLSVLLFLVLISIAAIRRWRQPGWGDDIRWRLIGLCAFFTGLLSGLAWSFGAGEWLSVRSSESAGWVADPLVIPIAFGVFMSLWSPQPWKSSVGRGLMFVAVFAIGHWVSIGVMAGHEYW